jgi:hypothetical protein
MIPDEALDAIQSVLNEEFNAGENFSPPVETADVAREDTPVLQIDDRGQARGPDGKFVSAQAPVETPDPTEEVESGEAETGEPEVDAPDETAPEGDGAETSPDGEVEEGEIEDLILELDPDHPFFAKYGGDPEKALEALENAQSKIGAQGSELGELRQEMQRLMQMVQQQQVRSAPYQNTLEDDPEALVYEALERGDAQTMQAAVEAWGEEEPFKAAMFVSTLPQMLETMSAEIDRPGPPAPSDIQAEMQALKEKHSDLDKFLPQIQQVLRERPLWQQAVAQGDPRARAQALEDVYLIAKSQAPPDTSAAKKVILRAKAEADKDKANATVVSASRSSAATPGPQGNVLQKALAEMLGDDSFVIED